MTPLENLRKRLIPDTEAELQYLIEQFRTGEVPKSYSAMERHFMLAKQKPDAFCNHPSVLALSFGGTNTKVMIASMKGGDLIAEYVRTQENPETETEFYDYLDELLLKDETVCRYLKTALHVCIGVSVPMLMIDNCPYHPTKIPTLIGFCARNRSEIGEKLVFDNNFAGYIKSRGFRPDYTLFYQSDGIVAHHGAVSMSDAGERDKTVLCICGTGMANGDEKHYLPIALLCSLPEDDELFPPQETENRQLNYAIAGKGVFSLMRRIIETRIRMGGSVLEGKNIERFFQRSQDTRTVFELRQSMLDPSFTSEMLEPLKQAAGADGFRELQELSEPIVTRTYQTLSGMILATVISMGEAKPGGRNYIYLEGSIAKNQIVKQNLFRDLHEKINNHRFTDFDGHQMDITMVEDPPLRPLKAGNEKAAALLKNVDTTLIGTATMVIAESCIKQ